MGTYLIYQKKHSAFSNQPEQIASIAMIASIARISIRALLKIPAILAIMAILAISLSPTG